MEFVQQIDIGTIETDSSMFSLYHTTRGKPSTSDIAIFTDSDDLMHLTEEEDLSACKALSCLRDFLATATDGLKSLTIFFFFFYIVQFPISFLLACALAERSTLKH